MRASPQNHHASQGKNRNRETSDAVETKEGDDSVASTQQALAGIATLPVHLAQRQGNHNAGLDNNLADEVETSQQGKLKTPARHPIDELIEVAADEDKTRLAEAASIWKEIAELREQQKGNDVDSSSLDAALRVAADQSDQANSGTVRSGRTDYAADQSDQANSGTVRSGRTDYAADQSDQANSGTVRSGRTDYAALDSHTAVGSSDDDTTHSSTTDVVMLADVLHSTNGSLESYLPPSSSATQVAQTHPSSIADGPHNGSTSVCLDMHNANQQVLQELLQPKDLPIA